MEYLLNLGQKFRWEIKSIGTANTPLARHICFYREDDGECKSLIFAMQVSDDTTNEEARAIVSNIHTIGFPEATLSHGEIGGGWKTHEGDDPPLELRGGDFVELRLDGVQSDGLVNDFSWRSQFHTLYEYRLVKAYDPTHAP